MMVIEEGGGAMYLTSRKSSNLASLTLLERDHVMVRSLRKPSGRNFAPTMSSPPVSFTKGLPLRCVIRIPGKQSYLRP